MTVTPPVTPGAAAAQRAGRVALPERDVESGPREELRRGVGGAELAVRGLSLRAACLPLLRHGDGGLEQAVRIVVEAEPGLGRVRLALPGADPVAFEGPGRHRVLLYVPEVREPRAVVLEAEAGGTRHELALELRPQRHWEVFLCHQSHLDIGYTDPQDRVLAHHLQYLDSVLELAESTDDWPEDARFRWNIEAIWPLEAWLAARPRAAREELLARAREGRIEVCALPFSMHTEAYSIDELARGLRFADTLREQGVSVVTAMQTDVPGAVAALPALLSDAGVRYLAVAHNYAGRSVPYLHGGQRLGRPFWWRAPGGRRVLVWYTDSPHGVAYMEGNLVGLAESADVAEELLPEYLAALASRPYPYTPGYAWLGLPEGMEAEREPYPHDLLHLRVQSVIADNAPPGLGPAEVARDWNARFAYPRLRVATNREFFERAEERLGDRLQTHEGDWTDWWADGIGSGARALGFNRLAQGAVRSGQTLHALADALGQPEPEWPAEADRAYASMALFDEHTWGAANPWEDGLERMASGGLQWRRKESFALDAYDRATRLLEAGAERLARAVSPGPRAELGAVVVLNTRGSARTELVRAFVPFSRVPADVDLTVVDAETGEREPHVVEAQQHERFRPAGHFLSFVARDVPACGFRRYTLVAANAGDATLGDGDPLALETDQLRLELDSAEGFVASLVDLEHGRRELVDAGGAFGFNQYVYDRYTTAPRFNHLSSRIPPGASGRWLLGGRSAARYPVVAERSSNAVWEQVTIRVQAEGAAWLESTYRLVRGQRRLDVSNRLEKIPTDEKESAFFAFPFALEEPDLAFEITGGVAATGEPRVPGSAAHMRAVRHWVALADASAGIAWATLEAPLVQVGNLHLPYAPFPETVARAEVGPATLFSWVTNNVWDTNFPSRQGGETTFRYAVAPSTGGAPARGVGIETAASLAAPLLGICTARSGSAAGSFCVLDRDDVEVVTVERSRRGHDLVLLLQSYAREPVEVGVRFPGLRVERVFAGTFLERDLREVGGSGGAPLGLPPYGFAALIVDLRAGD